MSDSEDVQKNEALVQTSPAPTVEIIVETGEAAAQTPCHPGTTGTPSTTSKSDKDIDGDKSSKTSEKNVKSQVLFHNLKKSIFGVNNIVNSALISIKGTSSSKGTPVSKQFQVVSALSTSPYSKKEALQEYKKSQDVRAKH